MKRLLFLMLVIQSTLGYSQAIKISEMVTFGGNPKDGYVPVVIAGVNRKVKISNIGQDKIDSISISAGTIYDTIYFWKLGVRQLPGKLTRAGGSWGTLAGSITAQTDLNNALNAKQPTLVPGTTIKTINGVSPLGPGNITISGSGPVDGTPTIGSSNPVSSGGVATELNKISYHKFYPGGVQELDTIKTYPAGDTLYHRPFANSATLQFDYTSDGKAIVGNVIGGAGGAGSASTATANNFVAASAQTMQRTADGDILTMLGPSAGGNSFSFRTNPTFPFINEIVSNRRLDMVYVGSAFFRGGYINFLNSFNAAPISTANSTATQSNSYDIVNVASLWNGTSSVENKAGLRYVASTSNNGEAIYGIFVNATGTGPDLFGGTRAIGINNLTRKVTIDNLNDGATDGRAIIGSDGEIKKGSRVYGSDYATAGNGGTYVIPANVESVGVYTLDGNTASTSVTLPNPASFPQRKLTVRNGSGATINFNSFSIFWLNGSPAITNLSNDRELTMFSDGSRWVRTGSNFTGL